MLSRVDPAQQVSQALCICPTRELAIQNVMVMEKMGKYAGISIAYTADARWTGASRREKIVDQVRGLSRTIPLHPHCVPTNRVRASSVSMGSRTEGKSCGLRACPISVEVVVVNDPGGGW